MPSRRDFLIQSSAAILASSALARDPGPQGVLRLNLRTSKLSQLRDFYSRTLHLPVNGDDHKISVAAGDTTVSFTPGDGDPFYHFAFNIPENKLAAAKRWLALRGVDIIKRPDGGDEYHFESWNAHAVYFLDPAGNILEFIARHNLTNISEGEFSHADILYASEIGLVVDDVKSAAALARQHLNLEPFANPPGDSFAAVGDDHRLLVLVNKNRPWNIGAARAAAIHPTSAVLSGAGPGSLTLPNLPYDITLAPI